MAIKKREALTPESDENKTSNKPTSSNEKNSVWSELQKHIMTGISNMIPFLIMGGLILAISQLIPYVILGVDPSQEILDAINSGNYTGFNFTLLQFAQLCSDFGGRLFSFAIPMFAAFMAMSIGGKIAFPAGFIGGLMATTPTEVLKLVDGQWTTEEPVASSFLGAVIIAIGIGYFVKWMNKKIKVSQNLLAFKSTFLIPMIAALTVMFVMHFVITPLGGALNTAISVGLEAAGEAGKYGYATALSLATAIDLGGPINKAAGFVALGFTTDHLLPITGRVIAIAVPSMGLGLATIIDKRIVKRHVFDKQFYPQGKTAIFLAFMGISEGSIPFMLDNPKITIPSYMIGSLSGSLSAVALGAEQWFPESAIWTWPLVDNLWAYILGLLIGAIVTALLVIFARNRQINAGKLVVDSND
ncbi:MAG: PTS fructose transporter subunit IIC [Staphylococcus equorum]|uniref:PTS EIIC type-2 domain-containing protein n=1 Tax=Tetragenococcus halophilus subsp. halophilus TaxID=1513897 RepID=A0A2H6CQX2_TETHA|nr:PTS fructose transporter subunit IIC [Tetragenococcus halophilus]MDN6159593.1 PTS fructose transporter subunit IIC [Staphylococcus equorum]MDN6161610.1 PTS fructose transporter subunit IIC [Atopostipes sp.]MDN6266718.1 PTS fructose transporter subunit IIC [Tetragenococcus koreensis]MDN6730563.1 PTS fructose transporter subunit IIC [Atopostipes suicloacalis]MDN6670770.1 PTS fructose transporter subunit IIC [Staphylococcus equorum]